MSKSSIAEKYLKQTKNKYAFSLNENKYPIREWISTGNLALNLLISADINKGFPTGRVLQFAGPPSVGKTYFSIDCIKQAQQRGYTVFYYDTEGGAGDAESLMDRGVDPDLFIHVPVDKVSDIKTDLVNFLESVGKNDRVLVVIDSVGNLVSSKEYTDTREGKEVADMSRAKEIKSMFRTIVMPAMKSNVPIIAINHVYTKMDLFGGVVIAGGKGIEYNSSVIVTMTKSKEEEGKEIVGSGARCTSYKNRFAKEKMTVRVVINYEKGLGKYSGLYELGTYLGYIITPSKGWRAYKNDKDAQPFTAGGENKGWVTGLREKDFNSSNLKLWDEMLAAGMEQDLKKLFSYQSATDGIFDDSGILEHDEQILQSEDNESIDKDGSAVQVNENKEDIQAE